MHRIAKGLSISSAMLSLLLAIPADAQKAPPTAERPWPVAADRQLRSEITQSETARVTLDSAKQYTLPELIDIAERNNPETTIAWEHAKQSAANLGIARSALFPTVAAMASASYNQYSLFFGKFYHEDVGLFPATLNLSYTLLDFGARQGNIDLARADLLASNFSFNDTHRRIIFQVMQAYYRLLDAMGQEDAAQATLNDAQTLQEAAEARLTNGLATLPDVLETRAASAQARYELASVQSLEQVARGVLATILGVAPSSSFHIQQIANLSPAQAIEEPVQTAIERALLQRPDLLAQAEHLRAAAAQVKEARSAYYPALSFSGNWGHSNGFGAQDFGPTVRSSIYPYQAQFKLSWDVFDGGARRNDLARAESSRREAQSQLANLRDQVEDEVWSSYYDVKAAQAQEDAAEALFQAADQSYQAATQAYQLGVRTLIDVLNAQRDLARARTAQVTARTELLTRLADFASRVGDLLQGAPAPGKP